MDLYQDKATWGVLELAITNSNRADLGIKPLSEMPATQAALPQAQQDGNSTYLEQNDAGATSPLAMPSLEISSIPSNPELVGDGNWPITAMRQLDELSDQISLLPPDVTDASGLPTYRMKAKPRGIGVIISNRIFTCDMPMRNGTDKDASALEKLFTYLGFYTNRYDNLKAADMEHKLKEVASLNHKDYDCLMVAILTHGKQGKLYGTDKTIPIAPLINLFDGNNCPMLIGKPKIFLIQACRGDDYDHGVNMIDGNDTTDSGTLPTMSDYILAYSTIPGSVSWRNSATGSWFIYTLVGVFKDNAHKEHLLDMLTEVNRRMTELRLGSGGYKQQPEPVTGLRKKLYFNPGKY
ncbi:caspase-7-like isoform X2 [Dysidea avara]